MKIPVYLGTSRKGNYSQHIAEMVVELLNQRDGVEAEIVSSQKYHISFENEGRPAAIPELTKKVAAADGFVIVSPEYNHGYPATLKYLLDLNYDEFRYKPVGIVGVSMGPFGGTRMIENLLSVLKSLGMVTIRPDLYVTDVQHEIDEQGQFKDKAKWEQRADRLLDELLNVIQRMGNAAS